MRPMSRFGTTSSSAIVDRLSIRNHDKINHSFSSRQHLQPWTSNTSISETRRKLNGFLQTNHHADIEKENRPIEEILLTHSPTQSEKPEVIISTPSFQLICDRRRTQARHASADEFESTSPVSNGEKQLKSVLKKSPSPTTFSPPTIHRSRWATFNRRTVSFADDKGLQLAEIKMIDLPPDDYLNSFSSLSLLNRQQASGFMADFILPPAYRRLRRLQDAQSADAPPLASSQIVLESYTATRWNMTGMIAVRRTLCCVGEKRVFVRYTSDNWTSSADIEAFHASPEQIMNGHHSIDRLDRSIDQSIERYSFTLPFPLRPQIGARVEFKFGVRMQNGAGILLPPVTYWDDNNGSNYSFSFV